MGCKALGLGLGVWGFGGLGFWGLGLRVLGLRLWAYSSGMETSYGLYGALLLNAHESKNDIPFLSPQTYLSFFLGGGVSVSTGHILHMFRGVQE